MAEDLGKEARGLARPLRRVEVIPHGPQGRAPSAQQLRPHVPPRTWLALHPRRMMPRGDGAAPDATRPPRFRSAPSRALFATSIRR